MRQVKPASLQNYGRIPIYTADAGLWFKAEDNKHAKEEVKCR